MPASSSFEEVFILASKPGHQLVFGFDNGRLLVTLFEALTLLTRPPGTPVEEALADIRDHQPVGLVEALERQAVAVACLLAEALSHAKQEPLQ